MHSSSMVMCVFSSNTSWFIMIDQMIMLKMFLEIAESLWMVILLRFLDVVCLVIYAHYQHSFVDNLLLTN